MTALPLRVTFAVAGGLAGVWAKLAVARSTEHAAVARERRNIGESLFLVGWAYGICRTLRMIDIEPVLMLNWDGVGCQPVAINARLKERARSSAG